MIFKANSQTDSLGSCFISMDIGGSKRLANTQNLQIPDTAETKIIPKRLFSTRFSDKIGLPHRPDTVFIAPIPAITEKQKTSNAGGWVLRSSRGQELRETRSTSAAPPATSRSTFPRQHRPKDLSILQRDGVNVLTFTPSRSSTVRTLDRAWINAWIHYYHVGNYLFHERISPPRWLPTSLVQKW